MMLIFIGMVRSDTRTALGREIQKEKGMEFSGPVWLWDV